MKSSNCIKLIGFFLFQLSNIWKKTLSNYVFIRRWELKVPCYVSIDSRFRKDIGIKACFIITLIKSAFLKILIFYFLRDRLIFQVLRNQSIFRFHVFRDRSIFSFYNFLRIWWWKTLFTRKRQVLIRICSFFAFLKFYTWFLFLLVFLVWGIQVL